MSTVDDPAYLEHTRELAELLLHADDPYDIGIRLWSEGMDSVRVGPYAGSICALWGALTDWVECKPDEEDLARTEMVNAAREWLSLNLDDVDAVNRYFDHWLHDVCGYERS